MYGSSTGRAPIQVNKITIFTYTQNIILFIIKKWYPLIKDFWVSGKINKIAIDKTREITPPNLLGIERRIA